MLVLQAHRNEQADQSDWCHCNLWLDVWGGGRETVVVRVV